MALLRLGEYELLFELASGGMATLYVARQLGAASVERLVAVKRVHRHVLAVPGIQTMFRDEARIAALIRHPNVVRVLDVVEHEGELLIVLDYVESVSLSGLRQAARAAGERLPIPIVSRILADALSALHAAHEAADTRGVALGIVHRDFSPQNVLVAVDGTSQLIDFGVAKARSRATQTESGVLKGKFQYMSPEQARGDELDRRSDLFAAGIVLYEAITGVAPFGAEGSDPGAILLRIMLDPVAPASSLVDGVSAELDAVIDRSLERVRDERFATAAEMRDALVAAAPPASHAEVAAAVERWSGDVIAARRSRVHAALTAEDPTVPATPTADAATVAARPSGDVPRPAPAASAPARTRRTRVAMGAGAAVGIAALLGVGVFAVTRGGGQNTPAPARDAQVAQVTRDAAAAAPADAPVIVATVPADAAIAVDAPVAHRPVRVATAPPDAAPRPVPDAGIAVAEVPRFQPDGSLVFRGHTVHARISIVSNSTPIANDLIDKVSAEMMHTLLIYYSTGASHLPPGQPLPRGAITMVYSLHDGSYMPLPHATAELDDQRTSVTVESALLGIVGRSMKQHGQRVSGAITLSASFDVK